MYHEARLEINDEEDLFKVLRVCRLEAQLGNTRSVPKEKEKPRVLTGKRAFSRRISPAFLGSGHPLGNWWPRLWRLEVRESG